MKKDILQNSRMWLLYLSVFTLPMYMKLNNLLIGLFIAFTLVHNMITLKQLNLKTNILRGWPVWVFFLLAVLAITHDFDFESFKYLEKYWSFLLIPLVILPDHRFFNSQRDIVFRALLWGCVATLMICYGYVLYDMVANDQSLSTFFRAEHVGFQFTAIADTHPTYLGLFIVASILFLIQENQLNRYFKIFLFLFLIVGLIQLANRMTILLFFFFFFFLLINNIKEYRIQLIGLVLSVLISSALFVAIGKEYIKDQIFTRESITDTRRMDRWQVSYEILGVGFEKVRILRREKYQKKNYPLSAESDFNAHNQLLEYLSTNGALGGFVYVISMTFLLLMSIVRRDSLFTFIFLIFILANLTESTLVRIKGIEFFAIFTILFMCSEFSLPKRAERLYKV